MPLEAHRCEFSAERAASGISGSRNDLGHSIRVFSGNLWWGRAEPEGLIELIRRYEVDVFAAQELGYETAEAISSELPYGSLDPKDCFRGMGIALRRPAEFSQIPLYFRPARRVILDPGEWEGLARPLDLVNVHIHAPHSFRSEGVV